MTTGRGWYSVKPYVNFETYYWQNVRDYWDKIPNLIDRKQLLNATK